MTVFGRRNQILLCLVIAFIVIACIMFLIFSSVEKVTIDS